MTTIRTAVLALLLGAAFIGSALAAEPAQPTRAQSAQVVQAGAVNLHAATTDADAALRAEMAKRLDPRTVALIALAIGAVGIVAGIRRRRAMEAAPELV